MAQPELPRVLLITGVMAAGKSTIAQALAERFDTAAHVRGDSFRRMVVSGRAEPDPGPDGSLSDAAREQLQLRYRLSALVADEYARAGFTAVVQDIIFGPELAEYAKQVTTRPFGIVVLVPRSDVVARREAERGKTGYGSWTITEFDRGLRSTTPRLGLWLDTSEQTVEETANEIIDRLAETLVAEDVSPNTS